MGRGSGITGPEKIPDQVVTGILFDGAESIDGLLNIVKCFSGSLVGDHRSPGTNAPVFCPQLLQHGCHGRADNDGSQPAGIGMHDDAALFGGPGRTQSTVYAFSLDIDINKSMVGVRRRVQQQSSSGIRQCQAGQPVIPWLIDFTEGGLPYMADIFATHNQGASQMAASHQVVSHSHSGEHAGAGIVDVKAKGVLQTKCTSQPDGRGGLEGNGTATGISLADITADDEVDFFRPIL